MKVINRNKQGEVIDLSKITLSKELSEQVVKMLLRSDGKSDVFQCRHTKLHRWCELGRSKTFSGRLGTNRGRLLGVGARTTSEKKE